MSDPAQGRAAAAGDSPDPARIFLVDDDPVSLKVLETILKSDGSRVRTFRDPREALQAMAVEPPDVLVADWVMPGMDGPDLLKEVRRNPALASTYCLLVTAHDARGRKVTGLLVGADDYLTKPVSESELIARIRVGMRIRRLERQSTFQATAAMLGHEINNPLTAVLGYLEMVRGHVRGGDMAKAAEGLDRMEEGAERIREVVAKFLAVQDPKLKAMLPGSRMVDIHGKGGPPPSS
jgi:sigma-B regulation protein RsbU (phosphoserine phosphatase)